MVVCLPSPAMSFFALPRGLGGADDRGVGLYYYPNQSGDRLLPEPPTRRDVGSGAVGDYGAGHAGNPACNSQLFPMPADPRLTRGWRGRIGNGHYRLTLHHVTVAVLATEPNPVGAWLKRLGIDLKGLARDGLPPIDGPCVAGDRTTLEPCPNEEPGVVRAGVNPVELDAVAVGVR